MKKIKYKFNSIKNEIIIFINNIGIKKLIIFCIVVILLFKFNYIIIVFDFLKVKFKNNNVLFLDISKIVLLTIGAIFTFFELNQRRKQKLYEHLYVKRFDTYIKFLKQIFDLEFNENTKYNYENCNMLKGTLPVMPNSYKIFNSEEELKKYKLELLKELSKLELIESKLHLYIRVMKSYIDNTLLIYSKYPEYLINYPQIKYYLSRDYYKFTKFISKEININVKKQKFAKIDISIKDNEIIKYKFKKLFEETNLYFFDILFKELDLNKLDDKNIEKFNKSILTSKYNKNIKNKIKQNFLEEFKKCKFCKENCIFNNYNHEQSID